jgi:hypothetical protein
LDVSQVCLLYREAKGRFWHFRNFSKNIEITNKNLFSAGYMEFWEINHQKVGIDIFSDFFILKILRSFSLLLFTLGQSD